MTLYHPDTYWLRDEEVDLEGAFLVTALKIAEWADSFEARVIIPRLGRSRREVSEWKGELTGSKAARRAQVQAVWRWLKNEGAGVDYFGLSLSHTKQDGEREALYDHHDDTISWGVWLEPRQFGELQRAWKKEGLPEDLFYQEGFQRCVILKTGWFFGWAWTKQRCFSPREWAALSEAERREYANGA